MTNVFTIIVSTTDEGREYAVVDTAGQQLVGVFHERLEAECYETILNNGETVAQAAEDWRQFCEDMSDYRAVKYGNVINYSPYAEPDSNWVEDDGGLPDMLPDMHDMEPWEPEEAPHTDGEYADREAICSMDEVAKNRAAAKWAQGGDIHPSWNKPAHTSTWDREKDGEFPF